MSVIAFYFRKSITAPVHRINPFRGIAMKSRIWCGAAGSRLRSRKNPINTGLAEQIMEWFSDPKHPKIKAYPEAIVAESNPWYQIAMEQGWATPEERQRQYENLDK